MNVRKAFCFFEQSGTFKREFVRMGVPAEDYDIRNDFGETDHVIDLFSEIRGGVLRQSVDFRRDRRRRPRYRVFSVRTV
jgi:hypothetical protein